MVYAEIGKDGKDIVILVRYDDGRTRTMRGRRISIVTNGSNERLIRVYDTAWDRWLRGGILANIRDETAVVDHYIDRRV